MEDFLKEEGFRSLHSSFHAMDNACEIIHTTHPTIEQLMQQLQEQNTWYQQLTKEQQYCHRHNIPFPTIPPLTQSTPIPTPFSTPTPSPILTPTPVHTSSSPSRFSWPPLALVSSSVNQPPPAPASSPVHIQHPKSYSTLCAALLQPSTRPALHSVPKPYPSTCTQTLSTLVSCPVPRPPSPGVQFSQPPPALQPSVLAIISVPNPYSSTCAAMLQLPPAPANRPAPPPHPPGVLSSTPPPAPAIQPSSPPATFHVPTLASAVTLSPSASFLQPPHSPFSLLYSPSFPPVNSPGSRTAPRLMPAASRRVPFLSFHFLLTTVSHSPSAYLSLHSHSRAIGCSHIHYSPTLIFRSYLPTFAALAACLFRFPALPGLV